MPFKKFLKRLALVIFAPVLFLAASELILRAVDYGYPTSFLVPAEINGRKVLTDNQFFGYRFFSKHIARTPPCIVLDREKAPGTIRVFVLGESAAMGEPLIEFGMPRQLSCLLQSRFPGKRFEVVNAAMTAINSHVIVEIAREAARLQPDVFILYIGNNEVVGPYGPGTVFEPFAGSHLVTRARVLSTRLKLAGLLGSVMKASSDRSGRNKEWEGMEMFERRKVTADDPRLGAVRSMFRANIEDIIGIARGAGAEVLLCTVAVNLRDGPPFAGQDANVSYSNACALESASKFDESLKAFEQARDLDALRFRADSAINGILREIGTSGQPGVHFVDTERMFATLAVDGIPGDDYFLDHVHFNFAGNYALASNLAESVAGLPARRNAPPQKTPSISECSGRLLYTVWNELDLTDLVLQRMRRPPFKDQPSRAARIDALVRHKMDLQDSVRSADLDELRPRYLDAMRADPGDFYYPAGWAGVLYNSNQYEESERTLRAALALAPYRYDFRSALAMVLGFMGRADDGVLAIIGQDRKGGLFPAQFMARTGRLLLDKGRPREAQVFLKEAIRLDPGNEAAEQNLAACDVKLGRLKEAAQALRSLLEKYPDNVEALEDLAVLLVVDQQWDEALPFFHRAMDLEPGRPETRMKYALCFMYGGDNARAIQELEALLSSSPDFPEGHFHLGVLYLKEQQWAYAAEQFGQTVSLQPDFAEAWFQLARALQAQGLDSKALEPLTIAMRLAPGRKDILEEWERLNAAQ